MVCFDMIPRRKGYDEQLKCWDCMLVQYNVGDAVPSIDGVDSYSVLINGPALDPRYVIVRKNVIVESYTEDPDDDAPIFDKWGRGVGTD